MKKRLSCLYAGLFGSTLAAVIFVGVTSLHHFPFMADDYVHLLKSYEVANLWSEHFAGWLSRVPVWSVGAYFLFGSHVLEYSWWPMTVFFLTHALGLGLLSAALLRDLPPSRDTQVAPCVVGFAVAVFAFYPNAYEIFYWPTCMPYALGTLFMGLGAWLHRLVLIRCLLFCLAMLTYETFFLPSLCVLLFPCFESASRQKVLRGIAVWLTATAGAMLTRYAFSLQHGSFEHLTRLTMTNILSHVGHSLLALFRLRNHHMHTSLIATLPLLALIGLALWCAPRLRRRCIGLLLLSTFLSTGVYWFLAYGAMRAVYGAQVILCTICVWIICQLWTARPPQRAVWGGLLVAVAVGFMVQQQALLKIKDWNAAVLLRTEASVRKQVVLGEPVEMPTFQALSRDLKPDWVLPESSWPAYTSWLRRAGLYTRVSDASGSK